MKSQIDFNKMLCIAGGGGFAREVFTLLLDCIADQNIDVKNWVRFQMPDKNYSKQEIMGIETISDSEFNPEKHQLIIAIGEPSIRKKIVGFLPSNTTFATLIHPSVVCSKWVEIGHGSVITAGTILTTNIIIGQHAHLNLHTTIGHDCRIGDYFTTAPGVKISGECKIGECVYFGTNAAVRQGIEITDNVTIGMGGIVVKPIFESGVYIGNPVKKLVKS